MPTVDKNIVKLISKKIYLIRHAETDLNREGIVQGSGVDASINDFGRKQANKFYAKYKLIPFDKVYTSKLKRSIQTVEKFINNGIPHQSLIGLNEINWGIGEGMPFNSKADKYYYSVISKWQSGETDFPIEGGESPEDVMARQKPALEEILSNGNDQNILICMHGRAMRVFLCLMLNYPLSLMDVFQHNNLCLYILNYTGSIFTIETFNDTSHLNSLQ